MGNGSLIKKMNVVIVYIGETMNKIGQDNITGPVAIILVLLSFP
jgi:hypothetical protein